MSTAKKLRVYVAVGDVKWVAAVEAQLSIGEVKSLFQSQMEKRKIQGQIKEMQLNGFHLTEDDLVEDVLKEDEVIHITVQSDPGEPSGVSPGLPVPSPSLPPSSPSPSPSPNITSSSPELSDAPPSPSPVAPSTEGAVDPSPPSLPALPKEQKLEKTKLGKVEIECTSILGTKFLVDATGDTTMGELRRKIKEQVAPNNDTLVVDLHFGDHPILCTEENSQVALSKWRFQTDEKLFINIRKSTDQFYSDNKSHNYQLVDAWQPFQNEQSRKGMACFLSSLWVFSNHVKSSAMKVLGHLSRLINFPPAVLCLYYLIQKKTISNEQKSVLSNTLLPLFQKIVQLDATKNNQIFEYSAICFGYLEAYASQGDESLVSFQEIRLTCSSSYTRLVKPCYINENKDEIYSRESITPEMNANTITPLPEFKKYLLSHPVQHSIFLVKIVPPIEVISTKPPSSLELMSAVYKAAPYMKIVPTLSLPNAKFPSLTLNEDKNVCVYSGPEPCSVSSYMLFNPLTGLSNSVDPSSLAKKIGSQNESEYELIDDREIKEVIMVCFDKSGSMGGSCFPDMMTQDNKEERRYTTAELAQLLQDLKKHPRIDVFRAMYNRFPYMKQQVFDELSLINPAFKQLDNTTSLKAVLSEQPEKPVRFICDEEEVKEESVVFPTATPTMQIFIKSLNGGTKVMNVAPSYTIKELKLLLNQKNDRDLKTQTSLVYAGKILEDSKKLSECNIVKESTLWEEMKFTSTESNVTIIDNISGGSSIKAKIPNNMLASMVELKDYLWPTVYRAPSSYNFWTNLKETGDGIWTGSKITGSSMYNIRNNSTIEIFKKNKKKNKSNFNRLQTTKELFHALINRMQAYHYPTNIGLTLFGSDVEEVCPITPLFEVFRDHIDNVHATGNTALYDAIKKAVEALEQYKTKKTGFRPRIFCLSDGADTCSSTVPWQLAKLLQSKNIVLDVIMIGEGVSNSTLKALAKATGGYAFAPTTLKSALKINELETLLSILERPPISFKKIDYEWEFNALMQLPIDICSDEVVPQRQLPELFQKPVVTLQNSFEKASKGTQVRSREREILFQMKKLIQEPHPSIEIYPCDADIGFWRAILQGPSDTPYHNGVWLVYVLFPSTYPAEAPEVRFVTPIRHCNVNQYGKVCHSIFTRNWTSDTSIHQVLSCVYGLLLTPETDDPLDTDLALLYFTQRELYNSTISQYVKKHASKSKEDWKKEFLKEDSKETAAKCASCKIIHTNKDIEWKKSTCQDCNKKKEVSHVWKKKNGAIIELVLKGNKQGFLCSACWTKREEKKN